MSHRIRTLVPALTVGIFAVISCSPGDAPPSDQAQSSASAAASAETSAGRTIFETSCFACHSLGEGPRIGPDLMNIEERRTREWLVRWIKDPIGMAKTDSIGQRILAEWNNVPMAPAGLSDEQIDQVLDYIREKSTDAGGP